MKPRSGPAPTRSLTADCQLMQDYLQTAGILVNPTAAPAIAAFQNVDGESETIVIDVDGNLNHVCREPLSDSGWNMYGLGAGFRSISALDAATVWVIGLGDASLWQGDQGRWTSLPTTLPNGQMPAQVSVGTDGTVWVCDQSGALYVMSPAITQTSPALSTAVTPVAALDCDGLLHLFFVDDQGSLWTLARSATAGGWGTWMALSAPSGASIAALAAAPNQDDRMQVFAIGADHALHTVREIQPGTWSGWDVLAPPDASSPLAGVVVGVDQDGRLEVFAVCTADGTVRSIAQTAPNNGWGSWVSLGAPAGVAVTALAVTQNASGCLDVMALCSRSPWVAHVAQTTPGSGWGAWSAVANASLFGSSIQTLSAGCNQDGRIEVFALTNTSGRADILHAYQQRPDGPWDQWAILGAPAGAPLAKITVGQDANGILEIFALSADGALWHMWQTSAGSTEWSAWNALGTPSGAPLQQLAVVRDPGGILEVFGVDSNSTVWRIEQRAPNSTWGAWLAAWWTWTLLQSPALQQPPSGRGNSCWAVANSGGALVNWNGSQWQTTELPEARAAACVAVGSDDSVWALDTTGVLYRYVNQSFAAQPGNLPSAGWLSLSSGGATSLWATASSNVDQPASWALYQYGNGTWQAVQSPPLAYDVRLGAPQVSVAADGSVWILDGSGTVWRQTIGSNRPASSWTTKKNTLSLQCVAASAIDESWAVGTDGAFWRNFGNGWADAQAPLPFRATARQVTVGTDGTVWALDAAGRAYVSGPVNVPTFPGFDAAASPIACSDAFGNLQLFGIDANGALWTCGQRASDGWWSGWILLGGPTAVLLESFAIGLDGSGCLQVFAIASGALWRIRQTEPGSGWAPWSSLGAPASATLASVTAGANQNGSFLLFAVTTDGAVHSVSETGPDLWSWDASSLPSGVPLSRLAVGLAGNGCIEIVALGTDRNAYYVSQSAPNAGWPASWNAWGTPSGVTQLDCLALGANQDGRLQVFVVSADNSVYTKWETAPGAWSDWGTLTPLPGVLVDSLSVALDRSGCMGAMAVGVDQTVQLIKQSAPNDGWGAWSPALGSPAVGARLASPVLAQGAGGALTAFVVAQGATLVLWAINEQDDATTPWSNWAPLESIQPLSWPLISAAPTLLQAPSGTPSNCWAVSTDGDVINWNGSEWTSQRLPGDATRAASVCVGYDGSVWAVTTPVVGAAGTPTNVCYQFLDGAWLQRGGTSFSQAPAGSSNALWSVTLAGAISRSTDGGQTWLEEIGFAGMAQQLSVGAAGTLWVLDTTGTASVSVLWQRLMQPTGMPGWGARFGIAQCSAVAAGVDENAVPYAVFTNQAGDLLYSFQVSRNAWSVPGQLSYNVAAFGLAKQQDNGALIVHATSTAAEWGAGALAISAKPQGANWFPPVTYCQPGLGGSPLPAPPLDLELCAVDAGHWYWFAVAPAAVSQSGALIAAASSAANPTPMFYLVADAQTQTAPTGFTRLLHLPWARPVATPYAAVIDGKGNVHIAGLSSLTVGGRSYSATFLTLAGANTQLPNGVTAIAAVLQSDNGAPPQARLYAVAPIAPGSASALWVLRVLDAGVTVTQASAWSSWVPLDSGYVALANGPDLLETSTLYAVSSEDGSLHGVSQDPVTGKWTSLEIKRPSQSGDEIDEVAMYATEITLCDGSGVPAGGVPVTITAESPVTIWVQDVMYAIDADAGVTCNTDGTGKVLARTLATGLHTPSLTFEADGLLGGSQSVSPSQHVHDFLGGTGQLAVGGGPPASFTADTLVDATVGSGTNRQKLSPNLPPSVAATVVTNAGQITAMPGSSASAVTAVAGWAIDLTVPGEPAIHTFSTSAAVTAYRQQLDGRRLANLPGWSFNPWHDIKHAADDVVHAIRNGVIEADTFVIDSTNKVVSFTIKIGGQIVGIFDLAVKTVEDAMHAIEALLQTLIADIELVIEWLKLLFEWEDIWAAKEKIEHLLQQAVGILQGEIGAVQTSVQGMFTGLKVTLNQDLDTVVGVLTSSSFPYQKFADLPASLTSALQSSPHILPSLGASVKRPLATGISIPGTSVVHLNWLLTKALRNITPSFGLGSAGSLDLQGFLNALNATAVVADLQQAFATFQTYLTDVITHPEDFPQLTIVGFVQEAKALLDAVIDLLDGLAQACLTLVGQMLGSMNAVFNHHLDIPVISALYKLITELFGHPEDLTVLHFYALVIAVPFTIISKLLFGQVPFSGLNVETARAKVPHAPAIAESVQASAERVMTTNAAQAWKIAFSCGGGVNLLAVLAADAYTVTLTPEPPQIPGMQVLSQLLGGLTDLTALLQQVCSWPGGFNNPYPVPKNPAEIVAAVNYGIYCAMPILDLGILVGVASLEVPVPPAAVMTARTVIRTVEGLAALGTAIAVVALADKQDDETRAFELVKPMPQLLSILMIPAIRQAIWDASDEIDDTARQKLVVDALANVALPVLHFLG